VVRGDDIVDAAAATLESSNGGRRGVIAVEPGPPSNDPAEDATLRAQGLGWSKEWYMEGGDPMVLPPPRVPPLLSGDDASVDELLAPVECGGVGTSTCFSSDVGGEAE
jgi:hypothetical protein